MPRGGNRGGGTTVKAVVLTPKAASIVKQRATIAGPRYTKEDANRTASALLEAPRISITPAMRAALPALEAARQQACGEVEQGLAELIAALWSAA